MSYQPIWFDYNKITDELMQICPGTSIQMNLLLYKKEMKGDKKSFHTEYVVENNYQYGVIMKRKYNFYLSINNFQTRAYVMITPNDIILIRMKLNLIQRWFENSTFKRVNNEVLTIPRKKDPINIELYNEHKWLQFEPVIIEKEEGTKIIQKEGVTMNMYNQVLVNLDSDRFFGMKYLFDTIDMFTLASNMMNYIGRPEFGTNMNRPFDNGQNNGFFSNN